MIALIYDFYSFGILEGSTSTEPAAANKHITIIIILVDFFIFIKGHKVIPIRINITPITGFPKCILPSPEIINIIKKIHMKSGNFFFYG